MYAQQRRRERRASKRVEWNAANPLLVGVSAKPQTQTLPLKRKVDRVAKSLIARDTKVCDSLDNCCIPQVALYHAGNRSIRKEATHILK